MRGELDFGLHWRPRPVHWTATELVVLMKKVGVACLNLQLASMSAKVEAQKRDQVPVA